MKKTEAQKSHATFPLTLPLPFLSPTLHMCLLSKVRDNQFVPSHILQPFRLHFWQFFCYIHPTRIVLHQTTYIFICTVCSHQEAPAFSIYVHMSDPKYIRPGFYIYSLHFLVNKWTNNEVSFAR
jgi:hypothetical protein